MDRWLIPRLFNWRDSNGEVYGIKWYDTMMVDSVTEVRCHPGIPVDELRSIIQGHGKTKPFHSWYMSRVHLKHKSTFFRLLWPCITNVGWRKRNQQDATNLMFIIKRLCFGHHYVHHQENKSVHCCIWCYALVVLAVVVWSWDASCVHCESYCWVEQ